MDFTDFQKDCITKAKDQLHLIPRIDHVIRWKDMPGKVAVIVRLFKDSKLPISEFSEELKISKKALTNFAKGKDHSGKEWNELLILVNPDQFKIKQDKVVKDKAEVTVSNKILAILNREAIKDRGLRDETIKTELRPIKSRFISSVLNKLLANQKIERFIGENKKVMWKIPVGEVVVSASEEVTPQILSSNDTNPTVIEFPKLEVKTDSKEVELKRSLGVSTSKFEDKSILWEDDFLLKAIRQTMGNKFETEQSVVDHFNALLELGNSKVS